MIDEHGFRLNVGIILSNRDGYLFWAKRIGKQDAWQFPQGGIKKNETPQQAMYRELTEETGLSKDDVKLISVTRDWLYYHLPKHFQRYTHQPLCIGQKQKWFLLELISDENVIQLDKAVKPEFDDWRWVDYWYPLKQIIDFKKEVYQQVLMEFAPLLNQPVKPD